MSIVGTYGFTGRYSGTSEYEWNHPEAGATHQCMLFLRQESESGSLSPPWQSAIGTASRR